MKKILIVALCCLVLNACDTYPYKEEIQDIYDWNNQTGDKAICMMVGDITQSMYPYTIKYMEGQDLPFSSKTREAYYNRLENDTLHFFSGLGFFTEELVDETDGKPLYRYNLTELGRKYVKWALGETNFCFGRVVVDKIERIKDTINGVGGGTVRDVYITYHIENIPDWIKNPQVYKRFRYPKEFTTGEPIDGGIHSYKVLGKNRLETMTGISGRYRWASDFKKEIEE
jgi:hypothetical protein